MMAGKAVLVLSPSWSRVSGCGESQFANYWGSGRSML